MIESPRMQKLCVPLAIIFLTLVPVASFAQQSPLVVTGSISGVAPTEVPIFKDGRYVYRRDFSIAREETYFRISVRLTYHNRGDETLIVPSPGIFNGATRKILFLNLPSKNGSVAETVEHFEPPIPGYWANNDLWYLKELATAEPSNSFAVIEPGRYYETSASINVQTGYKIDVIKGIGQYKRDLAVAIAEHPYFRLQFSSAIKDKSEDTEPLRDAQRRWRRFGKLYLTSNGSLFLETDVIMNKLSD